MKLLESTIYSVVTFVALYVLIAVAMRVFDLTTTRTSHIVAGTVATVVGVLIFILFLVKKKPRL